jgi:putative LysE/RhtB family amino acid efflux pump
MRPMSIFLRGLATGFAIAAPVGPIGLLCIQRSLRSGFGMGLRTGLGAALADAVYGAVAASGLTAIHGAALSARTPLQLTGSTLLLWLGLRSLRAGATTVASGSECFPLLSTFALTLTNPMTILSFLGILTSFGVPTGAGAAVTVAGVFLGSAAWWLLLAGGVSLVRRALGERTLRLIRIASAALLLAFGGWGIVSAVRGYR